MEKRKGKVVHVEDQRKKSILFKVERTDQKRARKGSKKEKW